MPVGRSVTVADVRKKSGRGIVGQYPRVIDTNNDWNAEKMVPSITNRMNITETADKLLYSGGTNGPGRIFVSVHNAITNLSTVIKHIANVYKVLINLSRKSRSAPDDQFVQTFTYRVHFETDGGTDHRATLFKNQISYLGLFFIGNMDTHVKTCGCTGISYLNTCKRAMSLLNTGLVSLELSLDVCKDEWLITEVILGAM